jgi:hypothetical protein
LVPPPEEAPTTPETLPAAELAFEEMLDRLALIDSRMPLIEVRSEIRDT